jgi:hypothetical protein
VPKSLPKLKVTAATNRGLVRPANEDAIVVGRWCGFGDDTSHSATHNAFVDVLLAVADGLGGHSAGDVASRMVIDGLLAQMVNLTGHRCVMPRRRSPSHVLAPPRCPSKAVSRQVIKVGPAKGLARKQIAPNFSARARTLSSGKAVIKINGAL